MKPVALVTGGTRGIGLGIAHCLAGSGFDLVVCGVRPPDSVSETVTSLQEKDARVLYVQADVSDPDARQNLLAEVRREFGRLDTLVNNAGVAPRERNDILDATEESFEWVLKINLQGPYFLTQAVARWMIDQQASKGPANRSIINVTSISATVASVNRGEYCISKAGLAMSSMLWATRLAEFGISVWEVRPGIIRTDMTAGVTEKYSSLIAEGLTLEPRWGTPDDVGKAVAALATGQMPYSTGSVVMIDGGLTVERL
ncbi:MAG: 3-ketoacyl-ACP reductase [Acidobacteriota bacterium]|nr:MAG: 3-ketoacyl-ACP reductase [Acidobacteriota bacterium]